MASNGVSINPQVKVLDPTFNSQQKDFFQSSEPSKVIIHTGNVANWNSLKSRKTQLPINELYHSLKGTLENWIEDNSQKDLNGDCSFEFDTFEGDEQRSLLKITAKIMLQKRDTKCLEEALNTVLSTLKVNYVDALILATPPLEEEDTTPFEEEIKPYWEEMEKLYEKGSTKNIASCDLDQKQLEQLIKLAKIKPEVNQVNLTSCCHMPEDLVAYAKAVDVALHTHGDQRVMLPSESVKELVQSIEPSNNLQWNCDWILRYTVIVKCRGVIKSKGFFASIHSE